MYLLLFHPILLCFQFKFTRGYASSQGELHLWYRDHRHVRTYLNLLVSLTQLSHFLFPNPRLRSLAFLFLSCHTANFVFCLQTCFLLFSFYLILPSSAHSEHQQSLWHIKKQKQTHKKPSQKTMQTYRNSLE